MQNYYNTVKNKLIGIIHKMEKNTSSFVVDPKKDFVRKNELSFSKTAKMSIPLS